MLRVRAKAIFESVRRKIAKPIENHTEMEPDIDLGRVVARSGGFLGALGSPWARVDLVRVVARFGVVVGGLGSTYSLRM